jgi:hypothetical protein
MTKTIKRSLAILGFAAVWALPLARAGVVFTLRDSNSSAQVRAATACASAQALNFSFFQYSNVLQDNSATTPDDTPGFGNSTGGGNVRWAFQWDFTLQPGGAFLFSKDKGISPVPEPGALLLLGTGLLLVARKIKNDKKI